VRECVGVRVCGCARCGAGCLFGNKIPISLRLLDKGFGGESRERQYVCAREMGEREMGEREGVRGGDRGGDRGKDGER
jgi:hypothetical protein